MKHFILFYEGAPDYIARRPAYREQHLEHARASVARDELQLGGAFADPVDGAALLFKADSTAIPEAFAKADPYVLNGLVKQWRVREWTTVVGADAINPVGAEARTAERK